MGAALQTFLYRSLSTLALWGLCGAVIVNGNEPGLWILVAVPQIWGLFEFHKLLSLAHLPHFGRTGILLGTILVLGSLLCARTLGHREAFPIQCGAFLCATLLVFIRQIFHKNPNTPALAAIGYTLLGLAYIPFLGASTANLLYLTPADPDGRPTGHLYVLYLALVTKMSDCGAYVTGSLLGRHPMIPRISPKKTWEGFAGAILHSTAASLLLVRFLPESLSLVGGPARAATLGAFLGLVAVLGDLAESVIKRATGAKDSGHSLPGIGGALDLIDSLLFTAPLLYLFLRYAPSL
jgi:phosphatidate cytidylyltransferase